MYCVEVKNACSCFLKSGLSAFAEFANKAEAKEEAEAMLRLMNANFCHKHRFVLTESVGTYTITISPAR